MTKQMLTRTPIQQNGILTRNINHGEASSTAFSDPSSSSDEGSNDESVESLASISSSTLQKALFDQEEEEDDPPLRQTRGNCLTREKSHSSLHSGRSSRALHVASARRQSEHRNNLILPIFRIPAYQAGIMWTGNFRRTPIFIFSQRCTMKKSDSADKLGRMFNMTFRLIRAECKLLRSVLQSHGFQESFNHLGKFNLLWTGSHLKPCQLRLLADFHKVNHFPRSYEITRKDRLAKNVQRMQQLKGLRQFDFVPQTYILPEEFREFCSGYLQDKGPYIVKPIASSRGRGIHIVSHPEEIPYDEPMIVSRYISNPFLLDGFKFDVRIYAAVTSYEPLVVYIYEEGLVRFATVRYQAGKRHLKTQCMHLTNYSVNKKNFEFVQNDDANVEDFGNKWSLGALLRYLKSEGADVTGLMVRIEEIIIKSFLSVVTPIVSACTMFQACRSKCFELYGFDIIVDQEFRPWLLEVNLSPSLACDSPLDFKVKSHMLTDLFNLVGIVCHDPTRKTQGGMNSLHMKADGHAAVPPKLPTYFVSAEEQVNGRGRSIGSLKQQDYSRDRLNTCCSTSDGCAISLAGVPSSHLLPKGITVEESRLMRRLQEEAARAGGWIRLIPHPEVWEQYASIWPNDANPFHSGHDRRFYTSADGGRSSVADIGHTDRRLPMNSLVTSAFTAAIAISTLLGIVATIHAHEASDSSDNDGDCDDFNNDGDNGASSQDEVDLSRNQVPRISCASKLRYLHPNSSTITVDLVSHLHHSSRHHSFGDCQPMIISTPSVPTTSAIHRSRLALHNMPHGQMRTCLDSLFDGSSSTSPIPREQCQRVILCYAHTLSHMPFYLRKLGDPPVDLHGVCLRPACKHDRARKTMQCGIYQGTRIPERSAPSRAGFNRTELNSRDSSSNGSGPSGDSRKAPSAKHRSNKDRKRCTPSDLNATHKKGSGSTGASIGFDATDLSASQARHAFAAYLERIQCRLMFEAKQPSIHQGLSKTARQKEHRQLDLMVRFLRRASEHLSLQAIATICCKESINECAGDIRNVFKTSIPDNSKSLPERKRALASLLERFIEIYQYETIAMLSAHRSKSHKVDKSVESSSFWQFVRSASESQLETLLSQYTRLHRSVDVFMGRALDRVKSLRDERIPECSSRRSRSHSEETSAPVPTVGASLSSDSGFVSSGDVGSKHDLNTCQDTAPSSMPYSTIPRLKCRPNSRTSLSDPLRIGEVNETKGSAWSSCCPTLRRHYSSNLSCTEDSDIEKHSKAAGDTHCHTGDHNAETEATAIRSISKTESKKYQNQFLQASNIASFSQSCPPQIDKNSKRHKKHKQNVVSKQDRDQTDESIHACRNPHTTVYTTNSASQTPRATVSSRSDRSRHVKRSGTTRAASPYVGQPLMYSTRSRPRTATNRVRISSYCRPRSAYRNPTMVPLCSFRSIRPVFQNNHNADSIETEQMFTNAVNRFSTENGFDATQRSSSANDPGDSSDCSFEQERPGICYPLRTPFTVQSDRLLSRSLWSRSTTDNHTINPSSTKEYRLCLGVNQTDRPHSVMEKQMEPKRSTCTVQSPLTPSFFSTPSSRRIHPTL